VLVPATRVIKSGGPAGPPYRPPLGRRRGSLGPLPRVLRAAAYCLGTPCNQLASLEKFVIIREIRVKVVFLSVTICVHLWLKGSSGRNVAGCCTPVVPDVGFFAVFSAIAEWFSGTCGWASQSQRDCSYQPRVARDELPGVSGTEFTTLKGLDRLLSRWDSTPSGLKCIMPLTQGRPSPSRANLG
jgi:hypothetical protein